ncbi:hypothetical protein FQA39_LY02167 [Lamprigera yunnana]|nr:hypothetical protein FQA39_LY02167 [Lamprigera yunnana]
MSSAIFSLPEIYNSYKNWITKNPQTTSEFETTIKWISYFIAGRVNNSHLVSELVYSLSNLLVLFNDRIISQGQKGEQSTPSEDLKVWLTVLEYSEENVIQHPPIPVLQRTQLNSRMINDSFSELQSHSISFTLKNSGRVIRKVDSAPPIAFRSWKPLEPTSDTAQAIQQSLLDKQLFAETVYVMKPIFHLGSSAFFGSNTWKPWIISLALDLYR